MGKLFQNSGIIFRGNYHRIFSVPNNRNNNTDTIPNTISDSNIPQIGQGMRSKINSPFVLRI